MVAGEPYAWIEDEVRAYGASAYNEYVKVHSLIDSDPDEAQLREKYDAMLYELFVPEEDKDILWNMIQQWTEEKALSVEQTAILALPFLVRLQIEGETVIGDDAQFSGPVIGQYLITVLEALQLDSTDKADMLVKVLDTAVDEMIHSTILGGDSAPSGMIAPSGN